MFVGCGDRKIGVGARRSKETDICLTKITSFHSMLLAILRDKLFYPQINLREAE